MNNGQSTTAVAVAPVEADFNYLAAIIQHHERAIKILTEQVATLQNAVKRAPGGVSGKTRKAFAFPEVAIIKGMLAEGYGRKRIKEVTGRCDSVIGRIAAGQFSETPPASREQVYLFLDEIKGAV